MAVCGHCPPLLEIEMFVLFLSPPAVGVIIAWKACAAACVGRATAVVVVGVYSGKAVPEGFVRGRSVKYLLDIVSRLKPHPMRVVI